MPASSKYKALALEIIKRRKTPLDSAKLANLLGKPADVYNINLVSHYLLEFWKKGLVVRSEIAIDGRIFYLFGDKPAQAKIDKVEINFVPYARISDSSQIKNLIIETLENAKKPLTLADICKSLGGKAYSQEFYKKVCFHLIDLHKSSKVRRVGGNPYFYVLDRYAHVSIDTSKLSISSAINSILNEHKVALFSTELIEAISAKYKFKPSVAAVSVSLKRLYSQNKLQRSKTAYKADAGISGFVWSKEQAQIEKRILEIIPASFSSLFEDLHRGKSIRLDAICKSTKLSPTNAFRWVEKLASELPDSMAFTGTSQNWSSVVVYNPKMRKPKEVSHG